MRAARTSRPVAIALALAVALAVTAFFRDELRPSPAVLGLLAAGVVSGSLAWNVRWVRTPLTTPSALYLMALAAFHLGLIVPCVAGLCEPPLWLASVPEPALAGALLCVLIAFLCLEIGFLAGWRQLARKPVAFVFAAPARRRPSTLYSGGLFLSAAALTLTLLNIATIGVNRFFGASYGYELYALTDSRLLQTGLFLLFPAGSVIALAGARAGRETVGALAAIAGANLALLWAGDRGGAVSLDAAAVMIWTGTRGPLPRRLIVLGSVAVLLLVPVVGALRQLPRNNIGLSAVYEAASEASPLSALTEMGGSLRPLVETLRLVPRDVPHRYGRSYLSAAARLLPNLGLSRAESQWTDPASLPPNSWITYTVAPWSFASFGGLGFSAVAEPYLNFGVAGVLAYFLALGVALGRLDLALARGLSRRKLAIAAVVFMPLLITVRNDFHGFVRPAVWGACLVLLIEKVHRAHSAHTTRRAARPVPRPVQATAIQRREERLVPASQEL
jgi:hypothetical protein